MAEWRLWRSWPAALVRASLEGREIAAILGEDESIPADPKITFDPAGINIYADSWRVETGA